MSTSDLQQIPYSKQDIIIDILKIVGEIKLISDCTAEMLLINRLEHLHSYYQLLFVAHHVIKIEIMNF